MSQVIIYPNDEGGVCIVHPATNEPLELIAQRDVPIGKPYKIINVVDIPNDRTFRNAWEWQN